MERVINYESLVKVIKNMTEQNAQLRFFMHVCEVGDIEICQACLDAGININICERGNLDESVLTLLVKAGTLKPEVLDWLISKGIDINHGNISNTTALESACIKGNLKLAKYLIEKGGKIREIEKYMDLLDIVNSGNHEIVDLVLQMFHSSLGDKDYFELFSFAAFRNKYEIIKVIFKYMKSPNMNSGEYIRLLSELVVYGSKYIDIISFLLENGVDVNVHFNDDCILEKYKGALTAMDIAIYNKDRKLEELLLKYGGKESTKEEKRKAILEFCDSKEAFKILKEFENLEE